MDIFLFVCILKAPFLIHRCFLPFIHSLLHLILLRFAVHQVLPVDASCEDLDEDGSLSFLDTYVAQAIADGAQPYVAPEDRVDYSEDASSSASSNSGLKYDAYAAPSAPPTGGGTLAASLGGSSGGGSGGGTGAASASGAGMNAGGNQLGVKKANAFGGKPLGAAAGPWGAPQPPLPTPTPPPAAAAAQVVAPTAPPPPVATAAPVAEEPPKPKEMSEREKQAAMLFGGIGSGAGASSDTGRRVGARARGAAQKPAVVVPSTAAAATSSATIVDSAPAEAFTVASTEAASPVDLLNFDAPPPEASQNHAAPDLFGLSDLTISTPTPVAATTPPAAPPPQPQPSVDPFAAAGLAVSPSPVASGVVWQGVSVVPLQLTTPAFGGKWTGMAASEKRVQTNLPGASLKSNSW